jgi:Xaa-Pro aminopeptidase
VARDSLLIIADSERDADMLYATGMFVPDPFIYLSVRGRGYAVLSDLEIARARREIRNCRVVSLSACLKALEHNGVKSPGLTEAARQLLQRHRLKKVVVPGSFPHGAARRLRALKVKVKVSPGAVFPEREVKSVVEVKKISAALVMAEVGLAEGIQALKSAKIAKDGRLLYHNVPLTAEKLRAIINVAVLQAGGHGSNTIVACGRQACCPHERGHGVLRAHQPIVMDVFPRSQKTGYYGDITRTVVRGRAGEAVRKLHHTVLRAQEIAFARLHHRTEAAAVHAAVAEFFESEGYRTGRRNGQMQGFIHGLGHGLGLEVHEAPRLSEKSRDRLRAGQVVTIEPGLYYPGIGCVRLEDVALITGNGPRNLTKFDKVLEV